MRELIVEAQRVGVDGDKIQALAGDEEGLRQAIAVANARIRPVLPGKAENLDQVLAQLRFLNEEYLTMNEKIEKLVAEVAELKSVAAGVPAAIKGIKDAYEAALAEARKANPDADLSALDAVTADIDAATNLIADSVRAGTIADPAAPSADNGVAGAPDFEPPVGGAAPTPAEPVADEGPRPAENTEGGEEPPPNV